MTEDIAIETQPASVSLNPKVAETFNGLWASLFYSGRVSGKSVLVCASDKSEGGSTIACGLALAGSEAVGVGKVALVDFNLRNPSLHETLALNESPGISEVILSGVSIESAAQSVNENLDFYAVGSQAGSSLDVLRSEKLSGFLDALAGKYDYVIIDAAPANHFPDSQILAAVIKDAVLVSHTERTPREAVAQAKKRIETGGGKVVGLVLNMRTYPIPRFLYRRV